MFASIRQRIRCVLWAIAGMVACGLTAGSVPGDSAESKRHWSFIAPERPAMPQVQRVAWPKNAIDHFVLARLEAEGLAPSPEADKETLIRRVTLDLTGLPPGLDEIDAFIGDNDPDAYERVVDRLLASPRFGERMAVPWLYAARYADTSGYQNDGPRFMWRWRDWVIDAFNSNKPFDEFTIEQIAGDLMPNPTLAQRIATGFNRNHRGNAEGGIIPEEYAVEYVADRVETTSTVFLGITLGCARCHDHKYDPISQKDFYRLFAYFNSVPEFGRAIKEGNSPPYIQAPTREDSERLAAVSVELASAAAAFEAEQPRLALAQAEWEKAVDRSFVADWAPSDGLLAHARFNGDLAIDGQEPVVGQFRDGDGDFVPGPFGLAAGFEGKRYADLGNVAPFGYFDKFSFGAWVQATDRAGGTIISRMADVEHGDGYSLQWVDGRFQVNFVKRWLDDAIRVETERQFGPGEWRHVFVTYDGSRRAAGITIYVNGVAERCRTNLDFLNQTFANKEPLRVGGGGGPAARFHGQIDDLRIYQRCLPEDEVQCIATAERIDQIVAIPAEHRSPGQASKLARYFLDHHAPQAAREKIQKLTELKRRQDQLLESIPTVMVMEDMAEPRDTFILVRGAYDKRGERVTPGVPAVFASDPPRSDRLGLARWLTDPSNPLTARVTVNRFWQMLFGSGLVKTTEDLGTQGEPPSHPELLDWLATEFARSPGDWDTKAIIRCIVTSATYRQTSRVSPALMLRDPDNLLYARGPRVRLSAETIRDQVLAASGLLVEKLGGPSVKPYQPPGLWKEIATDGEYVQDHGENLYRRSLYTYWKRTVAPPTMITFDATARESCTVRETRTNTPLQALTLLNEVGFVESARRLAERMMDEGGSTFEERITYAFRLATARKPAPEELDILTTALGDFLDQFRSQPNQAELLLAIGEWPRNNRMDAVELAAYSAVANLILNLDETVTKQ